MTKEPLFVKSDDVHARLQGGIVKYKSDYVYVLETDDMKIRITKLPYSQDNEKSWVSSNSKDLNVYNIPTGYVNTSENTAIYVLRQPLKQQKLAISSMTLGWLSYNGNWGRISNDLLLSKRFHNMLTGVYPSPEEILKKIESKCSQAFSKDFAISCDKNNPYLNMQGQEIGTVTKQAATEDKEFSTVTVNIKEEHDNCFLSRRLSAFGLNVL